MCNEFKYSDDTTFLFKYNDDTTFLFKYSDDTTFLFKYSDDTTFLNLFKHLRNSFIIVNSSLYKYKKLSHLLYKDEKNEINLFLHNLLYRYWNIINFMSLSLMIMLSFLIKLLYKKIEKLSKSKLPPKFYEIFFINLLNKANSIMFLLNKIKHIITNINNRIVIYETNLTYKQSGNKQKNIKVKLDINIDFIKKIIKSTINITEEIMKITFSLTNIFNKTIKTNKITKINKKTETNKVIEVSEKTNKITKINETPNKTKDLAILIIEKQKLPNTDTENKISKNLKNNKINEDNTLKNKINNNYTNINNKEEKYNKIYNRNTNYKSEIVLKKLNKIDQEIDDVFKIKNNRNNHLMINKTDKNTYKEKNWLDDNKSDTNLKSLTHTKNHDIDSAAHHSSLNSLELELSEMNKFVKIYK